MSGYIKGTNNGVWADPATIALMRQLVEVEGHAFAYVARMLGVSRSAVIGKCRRLGIQSQNSPMLPPLRPDHVGRARPGRPISQPKAPSMPEPIPEPEGQRVHILNLMHQTCKFPMWDHQEQPSHQYCGGPTVTGRPYCERHCAVAYQVVRRA